MDQDPATTWRHAIEAAARQGDHLLAYDLSQQALEACPDQLAFDHAAILALARSGVTEAARARYEAVAGRLGAVTDQSLALDFAALDGRLWKDQALRSKGAEVETCWRKAALAYEAAYQRHPGAAYPAINAATCHLACGESAAARTFAQIALDCAETEPPGYWPIATRIEALLILGRAADASEAARALPALALANHDQVATTRRQLALVASLTGVAFDPNLLPAPQVLFWPSGDEPVSPDQASVLLGGTPAIIFLPLLTAADLATASTLAMSGGRLHVVLPCAPETWLASHPAGSTLADALHSALSHSAEPLLVTSEGGVHEPAARALCQRQAAGLAVLRARALAVPARTVRHVAAGFQPTDLDPGVVADTKDDAIFPYPETLRRHPCAILFGDVRGFSKLSEAGQLQFLETIIGGFAAVLEGYASVQYAETAGDGLFVVLSDIAAAASCCFALREVLDPVRIAAAGLPPHLALRLSAHVGPLHRRYDPVIRRDKFCGMEVIRTARIEPVTPVGEIFVTEQFAAALAYVEPDAFVCEYAGRQAMAKGFGACRIYSLRVMAR